eukprot:TRINITY_DN16467_c0_g1_i1.p1 TRINITY_DN16467_c0_g1~~TRINITY_DN16467_c0_g1_i1.p1  ORF type:complete len:492 (+),score=79.09 TRINITY_DN16467_c0_g1_i1:81-1556(+)
MKVEKDSLSDEDSEQDLSEVDHSGKMRNVNILDEDSHDQMLQDERDLPQKPLHLEDNKRSELGLYLYSVVTPMAEKIIFFAIVYYMSFSFPHSLILVATYAFFMKFFKLLASQWLREVIDKFQKFNVVIVLTILKALFAITVSLNMLLINILYEQPSVPWNEPKFNVMFFFILLCGVVCHLASSLCCQMTCVEWIRVISSDSSSSDSPERDISSVYHRIHQVSDMFAPFIIAGIIYLTNEMISLSVVIGWLFVECILEIILLVNIKNNHPQVVASTFQSSPPPIQISEDDGFFSLELLRELLRERGLNSYAMILSHFSVLTSTAPVVLNYLITLNYLSVEVALVLGLGTGFELLGSIFLPSLVKKIGSPQCSLACLWIYFFLNISSFIPMFIPSSLSKWILMVSLFTSRLFFLGYTYSEKLIFKEIVRNELLEELEMQYSGISSLFSYVLCVFLILPSRFVIVSGLSVCMVFLASVLYTIGFWKKRSVERE